MDTKTDDGGPAFPITSATGDPRDGVYCSNGMTLRDYFAGQALAGLLANDTFCERLKNEVAVIAVKKGLTDTVSFQMEITAGVSMQYADAMLKARGQ